MEKDTESFHPNRKRIPLQIYVATLGLIAISILVSTIVACTMDPNEFTLFYFTWYGLIFSLSTYIIRGLDFGTISLLVAFISGSLILIPVTAIAMWGTWQKKTWGRTFNLIYLGSLFPLLIVLPVLIVPLLPHADTFFPICPMLLLALSLCAFNAFYFFWFLRNKKPFE